MTMTLQSAGGKAAPATPGLLGSWVEAHEESCRRGRTYRLLVNHRTHQVIELTDTEAGICGQLGNGQAPDASPAAAAFAA